MKTRYSLTSLAIAGSFVVAGTIGATAQSATPASGDACSIIASAKFQQWRQTRLKVERTKTFADDTITKDNLIVTENTAFKEDRGSWTAAGITLRERAVPSPRQILHDMRLNQCAQAGRETLDGQSAMIFTYSYLPDDAGYTAQGHIWVSETSGLPLREDFQEPSPPANQKIAKAISATYTYNDDVHIPQSAELANSQRLFNTASVVRSMQSGGGGLGGAQQ